MSNFPTWKKITVGDKKLSTELIEKVKEVAILDPYCKQIAKFRSNILSPVKKELDLVIVSNEDLGLKSYIDKEKVWREAEKRGLEPCPIETAFKLRYLYKNQPTEKPLIVAHKSIMLSCGDFPLVICLHKEDNELHLTAITESVYLFGYEYIFSKKK